MFSASITQKFFTCNYCQNGFKTFDTRKVRCSACCSSIERKLKRYILEELKELSKVYKTKRIKKSI